MSSIIDVLLEYGVDVSKEGSVLRALCPFHNDSDKPNFTVYEDTDSYYCFACGAHGDVVKFVSEMDSISRAEARQKLQGKTVDLEDLQQMVDGLSVPDTETSYNTEVNIIVSKMFKLAARSNPDKIKDYLKYMRLFDLRLVNPVDHQKMQEEIKQARQMFGNVV